MARILIAEDEPDIRALIEFTLKFGGHEVYSYSSGVAVVENAAKLMPDVILLDVRMPHMTGYEACSALKADDKTKDIPIVFLSAKGQESEVNEGLALGAVAYILKPFAPDHLLNQLVKIAAEHAAAKPEGSQVAADKPADASGVADKAKDDGKSQEKPEATKTPPAEAKEPTTGAVETAPASPITEKKPEGDSPTVKPLPASTLSPTVKPAPPAAASPAESEKKPGENGSTTKPPESRPATES